jgi:hypothetical protein
VCSVCERPDSQEGAEAVECSADGEVHAMENALRQGGRQGTSRQTTSVECCGSVTFRYRSGSADPYPILTDPVPTPAPDPDIFVSDLQDGN